MKVVATKTGFFGGSLRERGATFEVPDNMKSSWWVSAETVEAKSAKAPKPVKKEEPKALSELKVGGKSFNEVLGGDKADLA